MLPKISIDFSIVANPIQLAMVLSGLDTYYSEIYIPENIESIMMDDLIDRDAYYKFFSPLRDDSFKKGLSFFEPGPLRQDDWLAALSLLRMAYDVGMISIIDTVKYKDQMKEYLGLTGLAVFTDIVITNNPLPKASAMRSVAIRPASTGYLEGLIYHDICNDIKPIYGDKLFIHHLKTRGFVEDVRPLEKLQQSKDFEMLFKCPVTYSVSELFELCKSAPLINRFNNQVNSRHDILKKRIDLSLLLLDFIAATGLDTSLFHGYPISSGGLLVYKCVEVMLRKRL